MIAFVVGGLGPGLYTRGGLRSDRLQPGTAIGVFFREAHVTREIDTSQSEVDPPDVAPRHVVLDLGIRQKNAGHGDLNRRADEGLDLFLRLVVVASFSLGILEHEATEQLQRFHVVRLLPPLAIGQRDHCTLVGHPLRIVVQRVIVPA